MCAALILISCSSYENNKKATTDDSMKIHSVLRQVYQWHETKNNGQGFDVIVKDTLQVGLDTTQLRSYVAELAKTNLFADIFIEHYKKIVRRTDYKLRFDTVKYYNEINFAFQDGDPWTWFQDNAGNYWDNLQIHDLIINSDTASLKWTINNMDAKDAYLVKLKRDNNTWKVTYLRGFDTLCCWF
jgi:hypothetical protein